MADIEFKVGASTEEAQRQLEQVKRKAEDLSKSANDRELAQGMREFTDSAGKGAKAVEGITSALGGAHSKLGQFIEGARNLFMGPQGIITAVFAAITAGISAVKSELAGMNAATATRNNAVFDIRRQHATENAAARGERFAALQEAYKSGAIGQDEYSRQSAALASEAEREAFRLGNFGLYRANVNAKTTLRTENSAAIGEFASLSDARAALESAIVRGYEDEGITSGFGAGRRIGNLVKTLGTGLGLQMLPVELSSKEQFDNAQKALAEVMTSIQVQKALADEAKRYTAANTLVQAQNQLVSPQSDLSYFFGQQPTDTMRYDAGRRIGGNLANSRAAQNVDTGLNKANSTLESINNNIALMRGELQNVGTF